MRFLNIDITPIFRYNQDEIQIFQKRQKDNHMQKILIIGVLFFMAYSTAFAAISTDDDLRLQGYAGIVGRGMACGINMDSHMYRVFQWLETKYQQESPPFAEDFITLAAQNAQKQKAGEFPEDCRVVQEIIDRIIWP
jgi:hypothetical protein